MASKVSDTKTHHVGQDVIKNEDARKGWNFRPLELALGSAVRIPAYRSPSKRNELFGNEHDAALEMRRRNAFIVAND